MAESVFKHQEDDGNLSLFASGNILVFACEQGHYWVVESKQQSTATVREAVVSMDNEIDADAFMRVL